MKNHALRLEEYPKFAGLVLKNFERDRAEMQERFPIYTEDFVKEFSKKIEVANHLTSAASMTRILKAHAEKLYEAADVLEDELGYLSSYCQKAKVNNQPISELKRLLRTRDIEGAINYIEEVDQLMTENAIALGAQGMSPTFFVIVRDSKKELTELNNKQNEYINLRSELTVEDLKLYEELLKTTQDLCKDAKAFFKDLPERVKEYTTTVLIEMMRG